MTREQMLNLIRIHNLTATCLKQYSDVKITMQVKFALMSQSVCIANEGYEITHLAREMSINAKVFMQTGEITVYDDNDKEVTP